MKRSLSQSGGPTTAWGDPETSRLLARCMDVDPDAKLPFTHGFHAYPARMHPEIARRAIECFAPQSRVLDPFVGSGTTALEAVRAGLAFTGLDISRIALEIAWTRTRVWPPADCRRVEAAGDRLSKSAASLIVGNLPKWAESEQAWYEERTLREIVALKHVLDSEPGDLRRALLCALSSLLVKLSRQVSDSDPRPDPDFRPPPAGETFRLFREKCAELTKNLLLLSSDLHKRGVKAIEPELKLADARTLEVPAGADMVLTSPPYPGHYDYALHHARRYPLYQEESSLPESREFGSRREFASRPDALRRYRADLRIILKRCLQASPRVLMLLGDGFVKHRPIHVDRLMHDLAREAGGRLAAGASQMRLASGPRKREHFMLVDRL